MSKISKKIDYEKKLNPIYIDSVEASNIYIDTYAKQSGTTVQYKIKKEWVDFEGISKREAVLSDSLFLRFINSSLTRNSSDRCQEFIVLKFNYDAVFRDSKEHKVKKSDLRVEYYKNGVDYTFVKKDKKGQIVGEKTVHFKMLMRSPGKAKDGECIFIREDLHRKAINFLTMGLYDLMDEQAKTDPDKVVKLVELSAYSTLITANAANGYIHIPFENILIVKDVDVYTEPMKAAIVKSEDVKYAKDEFAIDFDAPSVEKIINRHGCTFNQKIASQQGLTYIAEKSKKALKEQGIRINGKYPGEHKEIEYTKKECTVTRADDVQIKNVMWDGMGLIDDSIFPEDADGFVYCRSQFFKSCLFRGNIQDYFEDYCRENGLDYESVTLEKTDMFYRPLKLSDVKVIITDKSIKWLKFIDMMGGTKEKAFKRYRRYMKECGDYFSIVKTAHKSKWGNLQLMSYQMNNSLPTVDEKILGNISQCAIDFINELKKSDDKAYLKYLEMKKNRFNTNEILLELVKWNPDFVKTEFFRNKKKKDINKLKDTVFKVGRLPQEGDNLTVMGNPIALLMKAVGMNPLAEGVFEIESDGIQCYTARFADGESLAAFRSPHNSPNNILHLHNVYSERILKYFPNLGQNVIIVNMIGTDAQARASGMDEDTDALYTTNQKELAELARKAYLEYPTIINEVEEVESSGYHFKLDDFAKMDTMISDAQISIGTSTDTAQLALSYYYNGGMKDTDLEDCFIILSVIGQISIDLAKRSFDINVVDEINRIKRLPCMKSKDKQKVPQFFAEAKKIRDNKVYDEKKTEIKRMRCPMDIISRTIEENVISAERVSHEPLRDYLNRSISGKGNHYKREKFIVEIKRYSSEVRKLEVYKDKMDKNVFMRLKCNVLGQALNKIGKNLDQDTVKALVCYAFKDGNGDVQSAILNFLYCNQKEKFLNCFVKKG